MQDENTPQAGWVFSPGGSQPGQQPSPPPTPPAPEAPEETKRPSTRPEGAKVSWSASEYIANPKNASWFSVLAFGSLIFAAVVYLTTKDIVSTSVIVILGIVVGIFAARQPRVLEYHIDDRGIHIAGKLYLYTAFKSFSIIEEGAFAYASLMPLKRFMPPLAIHFSPDDEESIINTLADYLPYEEQKRDMVDSLSRRLRF